MNSSKAQAIFIIFFFKFFGFAPFKVTIQQKKFKTRSRIHLSYSSKALAYNFILTIPIITSLVHQIMIFTSINPSYMLGKCLAIMSASVAPVIIGFYCLKRRTIIEVWDKLQNLEEDLLDKFGRSTNSVGKKREVYEIVVFCGYIFLSLTNAVFMLYQSCIDNREWFTLVLFTEIVVSTVIFQYALIVNYINKRFYFMNQLLLSVSKCDTKLKNEVTFLTNSSHNQMILKTIILIRELQRRLYGIFKDISKVFSWPILLVMTVFCVRILLYAFKFLKRVIVKPVGIFDFVKCPIALIKEVFIIVIMARHVTQTTLEMQKTGEIIYKIMDLYSESVGIESELEQFSIEVLLRRPPKSIFGLFEIDSSFVSKIVRSTITYVIILKQFNYNFSDVDDSLRNEKTKEILEKSGHLL